MNREWYCTISFIIALNCQTIKWNTIFYRVSFCLSNCFLLSICQFTSWNFRSIIHSNKCIIQIFRLIYSQSKILGRNRICWCFNLRKATIPSTKFYFFIIYNFIQWEFEVTIKCRAYVIVYNQSYGNFTSILSCCISFSIGISNICCFHRYSIKTCGRSGSRRCYEPCICFSFTNLNGNNLVLGINNFQFCTTQVVISWSYLYHQLIIRLSYDIFTFSRFRFRSIPWRPACTFFRNSIIER